jgi:hypothetical protein
MQNRQKERKGKLSKEVGSITRYLFIGLFCFCALLLPHRPVLPYLLTGKS